MKGVHYFMGEPVRLLRIHTGNVLRAGWAEEQRLYMSNPLAFWLRPDGEYLSEEPYRPRHFYYDVCADLTYELEFIK